MAYAKSKNEESDADQVQRLMCTVPGCRNRWSVQVDAPKCSFHQWGKVNDIAKRKTINEEEKWWQK
jgi:hypothetical protein